ncbi:DUF6111 family protein [Methylobacterium iners]|jgi:hypothetical protein|uniref:Uncharacterized protein n=1 Tax=Methylobacterium iners TaxID=418707 RepID=A0ABQ4RUI5_9HYPH|nr:DUF6111 family protein [Methylobacterium iners]GJD94226.1 hypothetical protein OCOJLMKI_1428 [Methylobacterium iners]
MIRKLVEELLLFLLPFLLFYGYLAVLGRKPHARASWEGYIFRLTMTGIALVIASLVYAGLTGESHRGGYVPPRLENGRVVPGHFQ